jgi:hypothetical protein
MNFWETLDIENHRKVLVIPNVTNSQNIEKDSFVDVMYNHIIGLNEHGNYFWNIVLPKPVAKLNLENVKQHIIPFSGDMIHMRVTFPKKLIKLLQELEYDIIYSHLPDWYMVKRYTEKPIIGYAHWWEMKTCNAEDRKNRFRNIAPEIIGASQMKVCFLNTQDQKNRVLSEAKEWFNDDIIKKLDDTLTVWNLGVPKDKILDEPVSKDNLIVWPHRAAAYKGYPKFMELMKEYRERRQDFVVWVPQLQGNSEESWIDNKRVSKSEYYQRLQKCTVGVQMRQNNYGWSISATDCMMNGTPVIFQESDCYREIDPDGMFFKYKKDLFKYLDRLFDDTNFRLFESKRSIERADELYTNEQEMIEYLHKLLGE